MKSSESSVATECSQPVLSLVAADVPDTSLTLDELGSRIVALAGRLAAATCRWLLLVADFDARDGCTQFGLTSTAQWLEYSCGLARRTAVDHVRVARSLAAWPRLAEEMAAGRLSYSHVRAISRIAGDGRADLVEDLINLALHGTVQQVESTVRGLRTVRDSIDGPTPPEEYVKHTWTASSQWRVSSRLDPERGAVVERAIAAIAKAEGVSLADGLVRLAEIGLAAVAAGGRQRTLRGEEHAAVVVHIDASRLIERADRNGSDAEADTTGTTDAAGTQASPGPRSAERGRPLGRIERGPGLPDDVVERLACRGRVRVVVRDGRSERSDVLDLGRSRRLVSRRQFLALLLRDGGCAHPGCRSRHGLEAHHVRHWLYGGRTDLANLVLLCRRHHHAHHAGAFEIRPLGRGRFQFLRGDRELPEHVDPGELIDTATPIENEQSGVDGEAATPGWDGSRLDHDLAVWGIAQNLDRPGVKPAARSRERETA